MSKRYFTGKPCSRGHVAERYVSSNGCVECAALLARKRYAESPAVRAARRESAKAWAERNPEAARAIRDRYEARRPKNPEATQRKATKYREKNREVMLERTRAWRAANPEKYRAAIDRWKAENPDGARRHVQARRARKRGAMGQFTVSDLAQIFAAQRSRCAYCRCKLTDQNKQLDHIVALSRGGSNDRANLQYVCISCNAAKHNRDPIDFAKKRGMLL
jgi:5-methylcytosine-specific restriction endonuclease McrA